MDSRDERIVRKSIEWFLQTDDAVKSCGGFGAGFLLEQMSDVVLYTMVANDLMIVHKRSRDEQ